MKLPNYLNRISAESKTHQNWVESLPEIIESLKENWGISIGEPYLENVSSSYVARCKTASEEDAVLKIGLPHEEAKDEINGLIYLNGSPTINIYKYDKQRNAMLLERCKPGQHLNKESSFYQDEILCEILKEIWSTNLSNSTFRPLSEMVDQWNKETAQNLSQFPNSELAARGCRLKEELIDSTSKDVFLATDLHGGNILKAERREWLAIDIKPYIGDPVYDLTQYLMNNLSRLSKNPKETIDRLSSLSGVDAERLKKWMTARLYSESYGLNQHIGIKLDDI